MRKSWFTKWSIALVAALGIAACGEQVTLTMACKDHGGVRAGSIEKENDGGAEARCNDNNEAEQSEPGADWVVDD